MQFHWSKQNTLYGHPGQKYVRMARIPCAGSEGSSQEMPGNISTFYSVREVRYTLLKSNVLIAKFQLCKFCRRQYISFRKVKTTIFAAVMNF